MFDADTRAAIERVAAEKKLEPAALLAIAEVESGGRAFAIVNGQREPLIRFEGHYFDRLLSGKDRVKARKAGLASPVAGAVKNPATQAARWRMLDNAMAIDRVAALQSVSWGIGQVMGAHWEDIGYGSVDALVDEARSGVEGQIRLMLRFIEANALTGLLKARDWAGFARAYNGPAYRKNRYDSRMAQAYARYGGAAPEADGLLRMGARGKAVRDLQAKLGAAGFAVATDGDFGPATDTALRAFQMAAGLAADGVAGPKTMAALEKGVPAPQPDLSPTEIDDALEKEFEGGPRPLDAPQTPKPSIWAAFLAFLLSLIHPRKGK